MYRAAILALVSWIGFAIGWSVKGELQSRIARPPVPSVSIIRADRVRLNIVPPEQYTEHDRRNLQLFRVRTGTGEVIEYRPRKDSPVWSLCVFADDDENPTNYLFQPE